MSKNELLNCADAATFLTFDNGLSHGKGRFNTTTSCDTFTLMTKGSMIDWPTVFGHELGHNFGADHDVAQMKENERKRYIPGSDNHGHHIQNGFFQPQDSGYKTVMAYDGPVHKKHSNYYSNPNVKFPGTGEPTGILGVSNNAKVITEDRFLMASCGNEGSLVNGECKVLVSC